MRFALIVNICITTNLTGTIYRLSPCVDAIESISTVWLWVSTNTEPAVFIFPSCLNFKRFRASDQGGGCSAFSKAEEGHNNEWWLAGAGYTAKSLGKQPRSHSSPHSPRWITVQCPSANLLNLVWPQRKHKTQAVHMLPPLFQRRRPVTFLLAQRAKRCTATPPFPPRYTYLKTHD